MASMRVHDLAKEYGLTSKEMLDKLRELKIPAKTHASVLADAYVDKIRKALGEAAPASDSDQAVERPLTKDEQAAKEREAEEERARREAVEQERARREAERAERTAAMIALRFASAAASASAGVLPELSESAASFIENSISTASGSAATTFDWTSESPVAEFLPERPAFTTVAWPGHRASSAAARPSTHQWLLTVRDVP